MEPLLNTPSFTSPKPITLSAILEAAGYGTDALDTPPVEIGEIEEHDDTGDVIPSPASPNSTPPQSIRIHPVPDDFILADAIAYNREISEGPDSFTIAPILCLAGSLLEKFRLHASGKVTSHCPACAEIGGSPPRKCLSHGHPKG